METNLPSCQSCSAKSKKVVCLECHEQMMTQLGTKIRTLQGEVLELRASASLLRSIGQSAVRRYRLMKAEQAFGSQSDSVNLKIDHTS